MTETERNLDLLLGDALAENERLKRDLKYQDARDGHIGTHGPECWTFGPRHYECALRHIEAIQSALTEEEFRVYCKGVDKLPRDVVLDAPLQMIAKTDDGK